METPYLSHLRGLALEGDTTAQQELTETVEKVWKHVGGFYLVHEEYFIGYSPSDPMRRLTKNNDWLQPVSIELQLASEIRIRALEVHRQQQEIDRQLAELGKS